MVIKELTNGIKKITADSNKRITNKTRDFFSKFVVIAKDDSPDNYEEVDKSIWEVFVEGDNIRNTINQLSKNLEDLEDFTLNRDYSRLKLENHTFNSLILKTVDDKETLKYEDSKFIFNLLKNRIIRGHYPKKELEVMVDDYFVFKQITLYQYDELTKLLKND